MARLQFLLALLLALAAGVLSAVAQEPEREQPGEAAQAPVVDDGPTVVVIGHGPEPPDAPPAPYFSGIGLAPAFIVVFVPVSARCILNPPPEPAAAGQFGRFIADPMRRFINNGATAPMPPASVRASNTAR
jgi:hypothetical protein